MRARKAFAVSMIISLSAGALVLFMYFGIFRSNVDVHGREEVIIEGLEGIRPTNMVISDIQKDAFVVEWKTKNAVVGYVRYGDTSSSISLMAQGVGGVELAKKHRVIVGGLVPGRKYYFYVMSDEVTFGKGGRALEVLTLAE